MVTLRGRLEGGAWGLLVGDAFGVPYEFTDPARLPPRAALDMPPPSGWRAAHGVPPGTWSDDGAQALCLLASLVERGTLDVEDLGRRFLAWRDQGYMAVGRHVFDVGVQTSQALSALRAGTPADRSGPSGERANGNGALMRVLPLALWHRGTDEELVRDARLQCLPTHGHARSHVICALYSLWARGLLAGNADALEAAMTSGRTCMAGDNVMLRELDVVERAMAEMAPRGTGYVLDTWVSTLHAMKEPDFAGVIRAAVALGHDTDTTACVAGGLAGIRHGVEGIPAAWRALMREKETVTPLVTELVKHRGA